MMDGSHDLVKLTHQMNTKLMPISKIGLSHYELYEMSISTELLFFKQQKFDFRCLWVT